MRIFFLLAAAVCTVAATSPQKDFSTVLQALVEHSLSVAAGKADYSVQENKLKSAQYAYLPSVVASAKEARGDTDDVKQHSRGVDIKAELNLFRFGADASKVKAARAELEALDFKTQDLTLNAEATHATALLRLIQLEKELEVLQKTVSMREGLLETAKKRFNLGQTPEQEVSKFTIDLDLVRADLQDKEAALVTARTSLEARLPVDFSPPLAIEKQWPWKKLLEKPLKSAVAFQDRPDWHAARSRVAAADARISQARAGLFPSVDLAAVYGKSNDLILDKESEGWTGTLTLSVPLFNRLQDLGAYREAVAEKNAATVQQQTVEQQARSTYAQVHKKLAAAINSAQQREKILERSARVYQDSLARFQKGLSTANDFNEDQRRLLDTELSAIRGWSDAHLDLLSYCHGQGKRIAVCL